MSRIRVQWRWTCPPFHAYFTRPNFEGEPRRYGVCRWTPWAARERAERVMDYLTERFGPGRTPTDGGCG